MNFDYNITRLKSIIDHEISLEADKRDYHLLEHSIDEYLRATNVNLDELELVAERCMNKLLSRICELYIPDSNRDN